MLGVPWLLFAFVGVLVALLVGATLPGKRPRPRVQAASGDVTENAPAETLFGVFFSDPAVSRILLFVLMSS